MTISQTVLVLAGGTAILSIVFGSPTESSFCSRARRCLATRETLIEERWLTPLEVWP
jgi:hypothetical protein